MFDVSGAGDTRWCCTLGLALAAGLSRTTLGLANAAAGIVVAKLGAAVVDQQELFAADAARNSGTVSP